LNEQLKYNREDIFSLTSTLIEQTHKVTLKTGYSKSSIAFSNTQTAAVERQEREYKLADFGEHIIRKAINKLEFYQFSNLKGILPNLNSVSEFITSNDYLGKIKLDVAGLAEQIKNLTPKEKLDASVKVLEDISSVLASDKIEFKGSKEFRPYLLKDKIKNKVLNFTLNESDDKEYGKSMINPVETKYYLGNKDWFVFDDCFGTSEEKLLIKHIDKVYEKLKPKYDEIFLVRNERHFKIFNFEDGRAIEPDFVLFLVNLNPEENLHYQIFIEPKGQHLLETDEWKERFLKSLREEHSLEQLWKGRKHVVWGMPFFNEALKKTEFDNSLSNI